MEKYFINEETFSCLLHEIKTPVFAIIGFTDLLNEEDAAEDDKVFFTKMIKQAGEQLIARIDELIDYCRCRDEKTVEKQFFDLNKIMDRLYCSFSPLAESKGLILKYNKNSQHPDSFIYTDEKKLKQIFENLLSNALKYTETGSVEFGYNTKSKNHVELYVRDTGPGIRKEETEKIFEIFYRSPEVRIKQIAGTGIGLATVAILTNQLGCKVNLETEYGNGACFRFTVDQTI